MGEKEYQSDISGRYYLGKGLLKAKTRSTANFFGKDTRNKFMNVSGDVEVANNKSYDRNLDALEKKTYTTLDRHQSGHFLRIRKVSTKNKDSSLLLKKNSTSLLNKSDISGNLNKSFLRREVDTRDRARKLANQDCSKENIKNAHNVPSNAGTASVFDVKGILNRKNSLGNNASTGNIHRNNITFTQHLETIKENHNKTSVPYFGNSDLVNTDMPSSGRTRKNVPLKKNHSTFIGPNHMKNCDKSFGAYNGVSEKSSRASIPKLKLKTILEVKQNMKDGVLGKKRGACGYWGLGAGNNNSTTAIGGAGGSSSYTDRFLMNKSASNVLTGEVRKGLASSKSGVILGKTAKSGFGKVCQRYLKI